MAKHYVTFGQKHTHSVSGLTFDKDTVARFDADNAEQGRDKAWDAFGDKFFTDYHGDQWNEKESLQFFLKGYVDIIL